jgi:hydrogenase nickel incorporation protein HypA/HybF
MHELPVTENILEIVLRHAEQAGAAQVVAIHLVIGDLASIVDDSVQFYWEIISQGTLAAGARLEFERVQARFRCKDCQHEFTPVPGELECPQCRGIYLETLAGNEFYLAAIDIESKVETERVDA